MTVYKKDVRDVSTMSVRGYIAALVSSVVYPGAGIYRIAGDAFAYYYPELLLETEKTSGLRALRRVTNQNTEGLSGEEWRAESLRVATKYARKYVSDAAVQDLVDFMQRKGMQAYQARLEDKKDDIIQQWNSACTHLQHLTNSTPLIIDIDARRRSVLELWHRLTGEEEDDAAPYANSDSMDDKYDRLTTTPSANLSDLEADMAVSDKYVMTCDRGMGSD